MTTNSSAPKRFCYKIEKAGENTIFAYLFDDNVMFWIKAGWTVTRNGENLH
jgi:hypothetical protein